VVSGDARFVRDDLEMPIPSQFIACRTLGVAVQGINLGDVRLIPVVFPSPEEQRKIGDVLDQHDRLVLRETANLAKLQTTKTALMQDLLTGKVRVKVDEATNV
jgi:type I restriction enzyme S subunit